jgi:uncharacterized membrane protein
VGSSVPPAGTQVPGAMPVSGLSENVASALCYILGLITGILFLLLAPYNQNPNVRFHAFQSIFLSAAWIAIDIVCSIAGLFYLAPLFGLAGFVLTIYMVVVTYQGRKLVLPVIGPFAEQQAGKP